VDKKRSFFRRKKKHPKRPRVFFDEVEKAAREQGEGIGRYAALLGVPRHQVRKRG